MRYFIIKRNALNIGWIITNAGDGTLFVHRDFCFEYDAHAMITRAAERGGFIASVTVDCRNPKNP